MACGLDVSRNECCCLAVVVMGVSGAGKSTIGKLLAEALSCSFIDADDYHSPENIEKMRKGISLTDSDRMPWLESLRNSLSEQLSRGCDVVLACSALKYSYREILRAAVLSSSKQQSKSQFDALELTHKEEEDIFTVDVDVGHPETIVTSLIPKLRS